MRLLFALSVASFCTALWLALAVARRIQRDFGARKGAWTREKRREPVPAMEFFEAGEFRTPRVLRVTQEIARHGVERKSQEAAATTGREDVPVGSELSFIFPELPLRRERAQPVMAPRNRPRNITGERKPPRSAGPEMLRRVDLSLYNGDLGDLTDPYTQAALDPAIRPGAAKTG